MDWSIAHAVETNQPVFQITYTRMRYNDERPMMAQIRELDLNDSINLPIEKMMTVSATIQRLQKVTKREKQWRYNTTDEHVIVTRVK